MFNDKKLQQAVIAVLKGNVEEAKKPLHPNQQKLDVHEPEKDELTAKDFEMLRAGKKAKMKEEIEVEEGTESKAEYHDRMHRLAAHYHSMSDEKKASLGKIPGRDEQYKQAVAYAKANPNMKKEDIDFVIEYALTEGWDDMMKAAKERQKPQPSGGAGFKPGRAYGGSRQKEEKPAKPMKEDSEQIDELKKSTVASYAMKATADAMKKKNQASNEMEYGSGRKGLELDDKAEKRAAGVQKAIRRLAKIDEAAKWRSTSVAKKVTDPEGEDSESYDYHYDNPKSTGMKKATSDTPTKYGSLSSRPHAQVASSGARKGMITKQHAERLKARIKAGMNNEEVEYTFGDYLQAAKARFGEEEAVKIANDAFNNKDTSIFSNDTEA